MYINIIFNVLYGRNTRNLSVISTVNVMDFSIANSKCIPCLSGRSSSCRSVFTQHVCRRCIQLGL